MIGTLVFGGFAVGEIEPWALTDDDVDTEVTEVKQQEVKNGQKNNGFQVEETTEQSERL